ncbi:type II toxin-antitoxin system HigB family toxin [Enterobacter sp. PI-10]|uniref:type II toxin-antitoxin system HigB family toxin n=1 Tax=Enterobacter sp. PI-10 TaxID=2899140 RepID=UPI003FA4063A
MRTVITSMWKLQPIVVSTLSTHQPQPIMFPIWKQRARMYVVSRAPFDTAARHFPNRSLALDDLYRVLKKEHYSSPGDMRKALSQPGPDEIPGKMMGHRCGRGHLRVMFFPDFERGKIFIKHISTHAEYDKLTDLYRRTKE